MSTLSTLATFVAFLVLLALWTIAGALASVADLVGGLAP